MRPLSLSLEGFGGFRNATSVDFSEIELAALVGKTGAGKSTIIDAITFALYGMVSRYDDARLVHPVINSLSNEAKVQFVFESGGISYSATRVIRRTKTGATTKEARFQRNDLVRAEGAKEVTLAVERLLGLDFEQFTKVVVLPQGRFSEFLRDSAKDRRRMLTETLGVSRYTAIGKRAREISKLAQVSIEEKRRSLERFDQLDEDLAVLKRQVTSLASLEIAVSERALEAQNVIEERATAQADWDRLSALHKTLQDVQLPPEVSELESHLVSAGQNLTSAEALLSEASSSWETAVEGLRSCADLERSQQLLDDHKTKAAFAERYIQIQSEIEAAESAFAVVEDAMDGLIAEAESVDRQLDEAEEFERLQRGRALDGTQLKGIEVVRSKRKELEKTELDLQVHVEQIVALESKLLRAEQQHDENQYRFDQAFGTESVTLTHDYTVALRSQLVAGQPCPVCESQVQRIPPASVAAGFEGVVAERRARQAELEQGRKELDNMRQRRFQLSTAADLAAHRVATLETELSKAPTESEILLLQSEAAEAAAIMSEAVQRRETLASRARKLRNDAGFKELEIEFRKADDQVRQLAQTRSNLVGQQKTLADRLRGADTPEVLRAAIEEALILQDIVDKQQRRRADAAGEHDRVAAEVQRLEDRANQLRQSYTKARDAVRELDAPMPDNASLFDDWQELATWAEEQKAPLVPRIKELRKTMTQADKKLLESVESIRAVLRDSRTAGVDAAKLSGTEKPATRLDRVVSQVERALAEARGRYAAISAQQAQAGRLRAELAEAEERKQVHELLGEQLKASNFQDWILVEIVAALAARASDRLHELSSGQFSLLAKGLNFEVVDHTNGDARRDAKTLSGGETFLASLALALALADGIVDMSSDTIRPLESLFLDEGFGTLDDDYLDVVAGAVEELGAEGRMVVVITHIDELAERMPTRFELSKNHGNSSISRVEV